jgi:hypothetical protein
MENRLLDKSVLKSLYPHLIAIVFFLAVSIGYFYPVLQGERLLQPDVTKYKGMSKEISDYREKTGEEALWTNSMFSGMPAYQISVEYKYNFKSYLNRIYQLGLPQPVKYLWLYLIGFYILLISLRVNPWISIAGATGFAFSTYFLIIIAAGHNTKAQAIGFMAVTLAGILLAYRGKYLLGGVLTTLFLAFQIGANHLQITYYLFIIVFFIALYELLFAVKKKKMPNFLKATGILFIAAIIALSTNISKLILTYEYGQDTTRGPSELTINQDNKTSGLDKDYATAWSYGLQETFTFLIPNAKGGASGALATQEKALDKVDNRYRQIVSQFDAYWGNQPFTSGPVYVGAFLMFLYILSFFLLKGKFKWFMLGAVILSVMLAWGRHFMFLTDFFLDYVPGYNKFRTVSMTLVIAELIIPFMAILGLYKIYKEPGLFKLKSKAFYVSFGLTGGLLILFYLIPDTFFEFIKTSEYDQFRNFEQSGATAQQVSDIRNNLETARISIFRQDTLRSLLMILLGVVGVWLFSINKLKKHYFIIWITAVIMIDLIPVNWRYLNDDNFTRKSQVENPYRKTPADEMILADKELYFRVLNLTVSTFNDASTSYFHKSIGGYHGAKLKKYQELIEFHIQPAMSRIIDEINNNGGRNLNSLLADEPVLNMLNTKYLILNPNSAPFINNSALGNGWFIENLNIVDNADAEIFALENFDANNTAIIQKRFADKIDATSFTRDSNAFIRLVEYSPKELNFISENSEPGFAVFSDIYYDKGWKVFIDGVETDHVRVNYLLRGLEIPAGTHEIEFRFEPQSFYTSQAILLAGSIILLIVVFGGLFIEIRQYLKGNIG